MPPRFPITLTLVALGLGALAPASALQPGRSPSSSPLQRATTLSRRTWTVDGVAREALVAVPSSATTKESPVVFAFHGHGGTMRSAARSFGYHQIWPEAIVVYPQGLNTPGRLTDPEGKKPGWQSAAGDQNDRDLKLFDTMLASLKTQHQVDGKRVYATGHSNGGGFTYLLWATRGEALAAVAPSAAIATRTLAGLKPKPVLHLAGEQDQLVRFAWQERTITFLRRLNGCGEGSPWAEAGTLYASPAGTPVATFIHPGGHEFPREAPPLIVRFFKEHPKR